MNSNNAGMPGEALRKRAAARVPVLIGTTSDDLPVLFPPRDNPLSCFGAEAPAAQAVYFAGATDPVTAIKNIAVDITMHEPARFVARQVTAAGQPAWLYRFGYVAESLRPQGTAEHSTELPFLFGTLDARYGKAVTEKDREAARAFHLYIANFAKTGDPNGGGLPTWPKFDPAKSDLMMFTPDKGPVMQTDPWKARLDLVERTAEAQHAKPLLQHAPVNLGGTSWHLVRFEGGDGTTLTPDDKAKYTLAFEADGHVSVRLDCNRGRGTWQSSGPNQLAFGPLALTRAMCPPGSLHDRIIKDWAFVRSYTIKDAHLFLALMADGGIYEFEPMPGH